MTPKSEWALGTGGLAAVLDFVAGTWWPAGNSVNTTAGAVTIISLLAAAITTWKARPLGPSAYPYLLAAGTAWLAAKGWHVPPEAVASTAAFVTGVLAMVQRGQVAPAADVRAGRVAGDGVTVTAPPPLTEPAGG